MSRTHEIEGALRSLDAADHPVHPGDARARTDLERILTTDSSPAPLHQPRPPSAAPEARPARVGRAARSAALVGAVLVAGTVGVVALPSLPGGDQAFASWTPDPAAVSMAQRPEAAEGCRREQQDASADPRAQLSAAEPVIAERRGVWTTVVLAGRNGFSAICITDGSSPFFADGMIGSIGTPSDYAAPGPRGLTASSLGSGTVNDGELSLAAGTTGSDVVGIVYRSPTYGEVTATVSQGHFALWLPGAELEGASSNGVALDVTYRDGSTASNRLTL